MKLTPLEAMRLAIAEGNRGAGFVAPNPLVGCVILNRDDILIGKGFHERVGEAHAEINAISSVTDLSQLEGAHLFVTLEPCAHEGRTGSCAKALAQLPIASVTYGLEDPNPLVSGKGAEILRAAGKKVQRFTELQDELHELAEIFFLNMREMRPFVALKVASSLDGKVALSDGSSQWITGEAARQQVHYLRGVYDAVVSGVGTLKRDNPRLNSRDPRFVSKPQKVILLDPLGESYSLLKSSALMSVRRPEDLVIVTAPGVKKPPLGCQLEVPDRDRDFDLSALMSRLGELGIHSLFVEAGPLTASSFLRAGLVDRFYVFIAPKILGEGLSWTPGIRMSSLDSALRLRALRCESFGGDIMLTGLKSRV